MNAMIAAAGATSQLPKVTVSPKVYARAFGEEIVLLDFAVGEYYGLDPIGARVWRSLEAGDDLRAVAEGIAADYDVSAEVALADVLQLIAELGSSALVDAG